MSDPVTVWANYGGLAIFDTDSHVEMVDSWDVSDFAAWFERDALVAWVENQSNVTLRVVETLDGLTDLPRDVGRLQVTSGKVRIGSIEAIVRPPEGFTIELAPGLYAVTVVEESAERYAIHFESPTSVAPRRTDLNLGIDRRESMRPRPVLGQLGLDGATLTAVLSQAAVAARACAGRGEGTWVHDGDLTGLDSALVLANRAAAHTIVTTDAASLLARQAQMRGRRFWPTTDAAERLYAWAAPTDSASLIGVGIELTDGALSGVSLCLKYRLSAQDQRECESIVRQAYETAPTDVTLHEQADSQPIAANLHWAKGLLTVRVGPMNNAPLPKIQVTFEDEDGDALEVAIAPPLRVRNGHAVYELWLIGPREHYSAASVTIL